jgi:hydroxymethylbilane synthase
MAIDVLRIATRRSPLAIAQARWVAERIRAFHTDVGIELVEVTTVGDRDVTSPLTALTEVGAFVRAVQGAVLDGYADVAVHSCKDAPVDGSESLDTVYPEREVPWDVLCGSSLEGLATGARVGTGSPRRAAQLKAIRPDVVVEDIRGNVGSRLEKVAVGAFDAVVLAEAGLRRIGREDAIDHRFDLSEMVPAPAQAALAVEVPRDSEAAELVSVIDDPYTRVVVEAERSVLARTGAGCRAALGAYAELDTGGTVTMHGFVSDDRGSRRSSVTGTGSDDAISLLIKGLDL